MIKVAENRERGRQKWMGEGEWEAKEEWNKKVNCFYAIKETKGYFFVRKKFKV